MSDIEVSIIDNRIDGNRFLLFDFAVNLNTLPFLFLGYTVAHRRDGRLIFKRINLGKFCYRKCTGRHRITVEQHGTIAAQSIVNRRLRFLLFN